MKAKIEKSASGSSERGNRMKYNLDKEIRGEKPYGARSCRKGSDLGRCALYACCLLLIGLGLVACGSESPVGPSAKRSVESAQTSTRYFGLDSPTLQEAIEQARQNSRSAAATSPAVSPSPAPVDLDPEPEAIQCSVTAENSSLSPERREALRARIDRQAVRTTAPNFREREEGPSLEEMNQPTTPFEVRIPPDEVLDHQAEFFERRERATPDLTAFRGAQRADISREIEQTRGMTPDDIGRAVQRGDLSFEAAHAIATAEANREDYREKYDTIGMAGEPTFVEEDDDARRP